MLTVSIDSVKSILKRSFTIFLILVAVWQNISGQDDQPIYQNLQEGLSNKFIRCILKDSKGFMWFGTYNGLNKFDGTSFTTYEHNPDDSTSICHNVINGIFEDKDQNLWIATAEGLNLYNRDYDNFTDIDNQSSNINHLNNTYLTSLYTDRFGMVWIGTYGEGINAYDRKSKRFDYYSFSTAENQTPDYISCIAQKDPEKIWIGTRQGIFLFDLINRQAETLNYSKDCLVRLDNQQIACMTTDTSGNLWLANLEGDLYTIKELNGEFVVTQLLPDVLSKRGLNDHITALNCDNLNNLYIGRENEGMAIFNIDSKKWKHYYHTEDDPNSIASNSIWSVYFDDTGKTWIGTFNKGICLFDPYYKKFDSYQRNLYSSQTLASNNVKSFSNDGRGHIWIGTDGGGISIFDVRENKFVKALNSETLPKLSTNAVMSIIHGFDNLVWIGHWSGGVDRIDITNMKLINYPVNSQGIGDNNILCIYEDKNRNIWAGTAGSGLFRYNKEKNGFYPASGSSNGIIVPAVAYVTSILEDSEGTLWVGTLYGLYALNCTKDKVYNCKAYHRDDNVGSISSNQVTTLFEDSHKNLWIGTNDNGLNLFDKENRIFRIYQKKDGLASNTISGILEDLQGNLWISTNKGITRFNPVSNTSTTYLKDDGLVTNDFQTGSCLSLTQNIFFFGGDNGFNVFIPDKIAINPIKPTIYFTNLMINNQPVTIGSKDSPLSKHISQTNTITLTHKQTSITIGYIGISYTRTSRNQYAYMLEGFDDTWKSAGNLTSVTYTNLSSGKYCLLVKGANNDGVWNEVPTELGISVKPPLWKTWWAFILYVLLASLLLYIGFQIRIDRIKMKNSLAMERLAREKDQELTQAKLQFFTNVSHEFRTPLSLILGPLESILHSTQPSVKIKSQIHLVRKNATRLMHLVNELMDFRKIENRKMQLHLQQTDIPKLISEIASWFNDIAGKKEIGYELFHSEDDIQGWIDRSKLEKILNNILSNAFKYTQTGGTIKIETGLEFRSAEDHNVFDIPANEFGIRYLKVRVTDNGKGILPEDLPYIFDRFYQAKSSTDQGTGIGLTLVKSLVDIHHGSILAESDPSTTTVFTVTIPVDKQVYSVEELDENPGDIIEYALKVYTDIDELPEADIPDSDGREKPELLVVEDHDELRTFLANELKSISHVSLAIDGREGLEKALSGIPDVIVSDVMMPEMSGVEMCRMIKADYRTSHIPVILLTAKSTIEDQVEGAEEGADIYITKPFSIQFLKAQIKQLITSRKELYSRFSHDVHIIPARYAKNKLDQDFLATIIDYVTKNISNNQLGVESLADSMNLSRGQIYKKIKVLTGETAVEFIRSIRLKEAVKLMETRKYTLAEIAYETGFTSPSYFTRSFKNHYGKAPSEYMKV